MSGMDVCRDLVYLRKWVKALKEARGVVQVLYVLGHMLEADPRLEKEGWMEGNGHGHRGGDGLGSGGVWSKGFGCGGGCQGMDGDGLGNGSLDEYGNTFEYGDPIDGPVS